MNRLISASIAASLLAAASAHAQLSITWYTIDGGGMSAVSAGSFNLGATVGQPDAGVLGAGSFQISGGFWYGFSPVLPVCDPDVNQDGNADQGDVDYLINVIAGGDNTTGIDPDFNRDGNVDQGDIDSLINVIAGGPCP